MNNSSTILALSHPLVVILIGVALLALWRNDARHPRYLLYFGLSYLAYSFGVTSQILLVPTSHVLNVIFSGVMYLLAATFIAQGVIALSDSVHRYRVPIAIMLLGIASRTYFLLVEESGPMRLYCLHGAVFLLFLHATWVSRGLRSGLLAERVAYYAFVLFTLTTPLRTLLVAIRPTDSYGFDVSTYWAVTKISIYAFSLIFGLALIITIIQRSSRATQAIDENLNLISHDLRAPLATIVGNLRLLQKTATPEQRAHMQAIERSTQYQDSLIGDILAGKQEDFQPLQVNPDFMSVKLLLADLRLHGHSWCLQRNSLFSIKVLTALPSQIRTDERRLKQVLLNLLSNAALATRNGDVQLRVNTLVEKPGWARIRFEIQDNGLGIDDHQQSHLFSPHQRFDTERPGTGLGLYIAQRITNNLGGVLAVSSEPGKGSCFSLELGVPICEDASIPAGWQPILLPSNVPVGPSDPIQEALVHTTTEQEPCRRRMPSKESCQQLAIYAREGGYSDIEHWIKSAIPVEPGYQDFRSAVQAALERMDFDEIQALAQTYE
ncbi:MAG: HAMP domain-containing histidine kinase [Burkholderiaceae bacterium]|nr:HAMP domain-containing histidine kinase [Burkholderiaceae bacterium]